MDSREQPNDNERLRPVPTSLIGGDRRSGSGSLAKFAAMRRASCVS
jgi:hypothetical protein